MKDGKEELNRLRKIIESMNKSSRQYTLSMKDKSTFNIVGPMSYMVFGFLTKSN